jgi:hypothetical protein
MASLYASGSYKHAEASRSLRLSYLSKDFRNSPKVQLAGRINCATASAGCVPQSTDSLVFL